MDSDKKRKAISVHQRLLNKARSTGRPFNELLQYYAMERYLYRISKSVHVKQLVLKGALLLKTTGISDIRATRDIDLLNIGKIDIETMKTIIADCCEVEVEEDGLYFDSSNIKSREIRKNQAYQGYRFLIKGTFGNAKISIQIDMGIGDVITPEPVWIEFPTILEHETPRIRAYTLVSAISEKYQAMVELDFLNSRMKDFYDIYFLSKNLEFNGAHLQEAIENTFQQRRTKVPDEKPVIFQEVYITNENKVKQWKAFRKKLDVEELPIDFHLIVSQVESFLWPVTRMIVRGEEMTQTWFPKKGWS